MIICVVAKFPKDAVPIVLILMITSKSLKLMDSALHKISLDSVPRAKNVRKW